jgi:hypothetical protein
MGRASWAISHILINDYKIARFGSMMLWFGEIEDSFPRSSFIPNESQDGRMRDLLLIVGQVMLGVLVVAAVVILPIYFHQRRDLDHHEIRDEADRRGCRVIAIHRDWFGWIRGPFAGEIHSRRNRTYRVECDDEDMSRTAAVLIGPRRRYEPTEQLTWRWTDKNNDS